MRIKQLRESALWVLFLFILALVCFWRFALAVERVQEIRQSTPVRIETPAWRGAQEAA